MSKTIHLLIYSPKCIVIHGETKPYKDSLKSFGGKWNANLKHPESGEQVKGWIFPTKLIDDLRAWMSSLPENINDEYHVSDKVRQYEDMAHLAFLHAYGQ